MADKKKTHGKSPRRAPPSSARSSSSRSQAREAEFQHKVAPLKSPIEFRHVREIARLKTI